MTEIEQWLRSGAGVPEGLRLLSIYKPNPQLARMIERHPEKYAHLLVKALTGVDRKSIAETAIRRPGIRETWPFLSEPDCPPELKILAADKITAYRGFAREHAKLFSCSNLDECLETAKKCVNFYCQNRKIFSEFAFYKEHGVVLGKHPIFDEMKHRRRIFSMSILDLERRRQNLRDAIWRLDKQVRERERPDLEANREELLDAKRRELAEIESLIDDYDNANYRRRS